MKPLYDEITFGVTDTIDYFNDSSNKELINCVASYIDDKIIDLFGFIYRNLAIGLFIKEIESFGF